MLGFKRSLVARSGSRVGKPTKPAHAPLARRNRRLNAARALARQTADQQCLDKEVRCYGAERLRPSVCGPYASPTEEAEAHSERGRLKPLHSPTDMSPPATQGAHTSVAKAA